MRVQQVNNYSSYNPNFSAIKSIQYQGLFKKLPQWQMKNYKETIEKSLREFPEFMDFCNKHDVDIIFDTKVSDFVAPHMKGFDSGYDISIMLKIVYERLWNTKKGSVNEFLRKLLLNPIAQRVVVEHTLKQEGSGLSDNTINNFIKNINKDGHTSIIKKLKNANLEILKETEPDAFQKELEQIDKQYHNKLVNYFEKQKSKI